MPAELTEKHCARSEAEHLLSGGEDWMEMADLAPIESEHGGSSDFGPRQLGEGPGEEDEAHINGAQRPIEYRVYAIRWFGLMQLVLLNIIVSWDVSVYWQNKTRSW